MTTLLHAFRIASFARLALAPTLLLLGLAPATVIAAAAVDSWTPPNFPVFNPARVRPDFWAAQFNSAAKFDDLGIPGFRHQTLVSHKLNFKGAAETVVGYTVYLPPGYEGSDTRYPILYFMVGNNSSETNNTVVQTAHALIVEGELPPCIIVGLTGGCSFYGNQFAGQCQMHDFFFEEFLPYIEKTYRVRSEARYRHLQGTSAGGNGAMMYALKHPDLFGTVTTVAGGFFGVRVNAWPEMYDSREENHRPYDCFALLTPELAPKLGGVRLALWIGSADVTIRDNAEFHRLLQARGVPHAFNDWTTHPKLKGMPHDFRLYYEQYGKEILRFHGEGWADENPTAGNVESTAVGKH